MKSTQKMYMANTKVLRLVPNTTYIPLTCVGASRWVTKILGLASGVFAFLDTNMLVSFALGDANVLRWGSKPTPVANANGFASQWNIGLSLSGMSVFRLQSDFRFLETKET